jgi:vitamin B12 transporter
VQHHIRTSLYFCFVFASAITHAQVSSISGTVTDPSGARVPRAPVKLNSTGNQRSTVTNDSGQFTFANVQGIGIVIAVEDPRFQSAVQKVDVRDKSVTVDFQLHNQTLSQQVVVTASTQPLDLDESGRAVSVIDRNELDRRFEFSVAESLREVPGVRVLQLGGPGGLTSIRMRGLRNQDTSILVDGMRLRDPAAIQSDFSAFTTDLLTLNISRLEVLRGCGSSLYGSNALGGAVNMVSDAGSGKMHGDFFTEGGGLGFFRAQARLSGGLKNDKFTYSVGLGHLNVVTGLDGDDRNRTSSLQTFLQYRPIASGVLTSRIFSANGFAGVNIGPGLTANAPRTGIVEGIALSDSQVQLRERGLPFVLGNATVFPSSNDPDSRRTNWFTSVLSAWDQQVSAKLHYRVAYQLVDTRRSFPNGPAGISFQPAIRDKSDFGGRIDTVQGRADWTTKHQFLTGGFEWEREAFDNSGSTQNPAPTPASFNRARVSQSSKAVFAEDRWVFGGIQVTLSGRIQDFNLSSPILTGGPSPWEGKISVTPPTAYTGDIGVAYRVAKSNTKLRAHFGNAYRAPSLYERYGTGYFGGVFTPYGDPRLTSERSYGGDAGVDQYLFGRRAKLSATYFYTELRTVIGFDFSGIVNRTTDPFGRNSGYFNTNGSIARGVELQGQTALWKGFDLTASYTRTATLERSAIALGTQLTPRIYPHTATVVASQRWRAVTISATYLGASNYFGVISGRAVRWEGPRRLDTVASWRAPVEKVKLELVGRIENVLGQRYYEDGYRTPQRYAVAGIRLGF